jgi:hypothetical protein
MAAITTAKIYTFQARKGNIIPMSLMILAVAMVLRSNGETITHLLSTVCIAAHSNTITLWCNTQALIQAWVAHHPLRTFYIELWPVLGAAACLRIAKHPQFKRISEKKRLRRYAILMILPPLVIPLWWMYEEKRTSQRATQ